MIRHVFLRFALVLSALVAASTAIAADRVLIFAAASTKDALEAIASDFQAESGTEVIISLAGSGTLARQIEAGAPADIYIAANPAWMDYLADRGLIAPDSRASFAGNRLVIVRKEAGTATPETLLGSGRFAMGDPNHVPAGIYAKDALENLDLWTVAAPNAAFGENVRVALAMAARGDVDSAVVYRSDAMMRDDLEIAYEFPEGSHLPIVYPVALTLDADDEARAFLAYLLERAREGALTRFGFSRPPEETDRS